MAAPIVDRTAVLARTLVLLISLALLVASATAELPDLPIRKASVVIVDNDDHRDVYTDEYVIALAELGEIRLDSLITTYSGNRREYDLFVPGRARILDLARQSGVEIQAAAVEGTFSRLSRPQSGRIEDTVSLGLPAAARIVRVARKASPGSPLVIVCGGQLTAVADAYLQDPSIAPNVIVSGIFGASALDYNGGLDAWAWAIVVSRFQVVAVPIGPPKQRGVVWWQRAPEVPKARLATELPQSVPLFHWMFEKKHPSNGGPSGHDFDGHAAVVLTRPDYLTQVQRYRPSGLDERGRPVLTPDPQGPIHEAMEADKSVATTEFWRVMGSLRDKLHKKL